MTFQSILFDPDVADDEAAEPEHFADLHLDQVVAAVTAGREPYRLEPFFHQPLQDVEAILYRQHVFRDLEQAAVRAPVEAFADGMRLMHERLAAAAKLHYERQKQWLFLAAVQAYCQAVAAFSRALAELDLQSRGLIAWREYLATYSRSPEFTALVGETAARFADLAIVAYAVHLKGNRVRVSLYQDEPDMSLEVQRTFAKFHRGAVTDYRRRFRDPVECNPVEAQILDLVARLHEDTFARLEEYCARHESFVDERVRRFDREIQFYLAYLEHIVPLKRRGLSFTYPRVSKRSKQERVDSAFDLALAAKLAGERRSVVGNDYELAGPERILVVSGPNNGGKTTFARMFGQLHHLAALGLPVPGSAARLFLPDWIFTHFEREEAIETLRGKFEDELYRIHEIRERATGDSLLIMNESFGSTTLRDALLVGTEMMRRIVDHDVLCVFVTFVDELASLGESTVSMMSTIVAGDPAQRTFKVVRKPADGLAYAVAIAEKYGLTYTALSRRLAR